MDLLVVVGDAGPTDGSDTKGGCVDAGALTVCVILGASNDINTVA